MHSPSLHQPSQRGSWNSEEVIGVPISSFLATTLLDSFLAAGYDPDDIRVEEEWLRIATYLSPDIVSTTKRVGASIDEKEEPRRPQRSNRSRGSPGRTGRMRRRFDTSGRKEEDTVGDGKEGCISDVDMGAESDSAGSVLSGATMSSCSSNSSKAGSNRGLRCVSNQLFDYIVVAVMHQLRSVVYSDFRKTRFYAVYVRLRHLSYVSQRTLTHDDFDWIGRLGRGGYV